MAIDFHADLFPGEIDNASGGDLENGARFLSAFEDASVLCPELKGESPGTRAMTRPATDPSPAVREDWAILFGTKASDVLARPLLARPPSALLHPSLAAALFERLLAEGADELIERPEEFIALAEGVFRSLCDRHCLEAATPLPLAFRYGLPADTRWILRASHALDDSSGALAGAFPAVIVEASEDIPTALARVIQGLYAAPLESLLESVPPEINLYPGNVLLQPYVLARQAGTLRVVTSRRPEAWAWELALADADADPRQRNDAEGNTADASIRGGRPGAPRVDDAPHVFRGRGRETLRGFFSHFDSLAVALEAYVDGGRDVLVQWIISADDDSLNVLRWRESAVPDPGTMARAPVRAAFPTALGPCAAGLAREFVAEASRGLEDAFPGAGHGGRLPALVVDQDGWVFARRAGPIPADAPRAFHVGARIAAAFGDAALAGYLKRPLARVAARWEEARMAYDAGLASLRGAVAQRGVERIPNAELGVLLDRLALVLGGLARVGAAVWTWRRYVETAFPERASRLETAGALPEASAPGTTAFHVYAECARMDAEREVRSNEAIPVAKALLALCDERLALDEGGAAHLTLPEIQAHLALLDGDLTAAGVAQPYVEHKARMRRARHSLARTRDPGRCFFHADDLQASVEDFGTLENETLDALLAPYARGDALVAHVRSPADLHKLTALTALAATTGDADSRPLVVAPEPFPWLGSVLHALGGIVCVRGHAATSLAVAARATGVPLRACDPIAFERYPETRTTWLAPSETLRGPGAARASRPPAARTFAWPEALFASDEPSFDTPSHERDVDAP